MQIINKIGILINWPREFDMYQELIKHIPNNKIGLILFLTVTVSFLEGFFIWLLAPFTNSVLNKEQISSSDFGIISQIYKRGFQVVPMFIRN